MIRLSVSDIDGYLYWRENEESPLDQFVTRLWGYQAETLNMRAGKALKTLFSRSQAGDVGSTTVDGVQFDFDVDQEIALPPMLERYGERVFSTRAGPVRLAGKVDAVEGQIVTLFKLTEKFDAESITDSYTWRCYLSLFDVSQVNYHVFVGKYDRDGSAHVTVTDYNKLSVYAYPDMVADVHEAVSGLAAIAVEYGPQRNAA